MKTENTNESTELAILKKEYGILESKYLALVDQYNEMVEIKKALAFRLDKADLQIKKLRHLKFGTSSERWVASALFDEAELALTADEALPEEKRESPEDYQSESDVPAPDSAVNSDPNESEPTVTVRSHTRRASGGRKPLPANLPRVTVVHDIPEAARQCPCCQGALHAMGTVMTEQLDIIPLQVQVLHHIRHKYACRQCDQHGIAGKVVTASMPRQPIPGSIASPSTLAAVYIGKYADGMPLYRQEISLKREAGVDIRRATLALWCIRGAELLKPLVAALRHFMLQQPVIQGDETSVQVLKEKGRTPQSKSYMWVYRSGEYSHPHAVIFEYQPTRQAAHPQAWLGAYPGALMADGYAGWRTVETATHLGCHSHARRRFVDAARFSSRKNGRAQHALVFYQKLYAIEARCKNASPEERFQIRQRESVPILTEFKAWLDQTHLEATPTGALGEAVSYTLRQWPYLVRYCENGIWPIDNNSTERDIRPFTIGRRNWLFSDTTVGAEASAILYSIILTCRANQINPFHYLVHVLKELPQRPDGSDLNDLLPFNYQIADD